MYLFVYGTLKSGHRNNHCLESAKFIGAAITEPRYRLFDNGMFPMLVEDPDGYAIEGEVWRVDRATLCEIDAHEQLYRRKRVDLEDPPVACPISAYIYREPIDNSLHECEDGIWP